jgi:chorismate mutase
MKLYEECIRFVMNVNTTIPDDQMTKIKVVHLQKSYNFVVEPFFYLNYFLSR